MPRTLSAGAIAELSAQTTGKAFLTLLTLTNSEFAAPHRFVNNTVAITSNGQTFVPMPFEVTMPDDSEDQGPSGALSIDNIDRSIVQLVRSLTGAERIKVRLDVVMSSDLDTPLMTYQDFEMRDIQYDAQVVSAQISLVNFLDEPWPFDAYTPNLFPGLF